MDVDASSSIPSQSYTILRIKRKRNEEPLDALVVESRVRRKKYRGGVGVFQYAQTVEDEAWKDEKSQKDIQVCDPCVVSLYALHAYAHIQDRISRLAMENAAKPQTKNIPSRLDVNFPTSPTLSKKLHTPRYTVISRDEAAPPAKRQATSPPKVYASKDLHKRPAASDFRMYDAILSDQKSQQASTSDSEMEKFLPLLNDYLKIHDIPTNPTSNTPIVDPPSKNATDESLHKSDDYVWDVFYHRPASLSEWNSIAARTGTITGLPASVLESDGSGSDSEAEDEADEDSNAEEYYKNDYPDEESDSEPENSDEFHEDSDYDDMLHYRDDDEDF
ncbi:RNA polymerase II nuclear localization protein iwr1 [Leucoagaricus sp. SymC.cos]|nr:RNA polymerase II nuclear localization protein iwr1 [Leucoagaricus sp. SymC.cos]